MRHLGIIAGCALVISACSGGANESDELGDWTFCECAEMQMDYKTDIATAKDPEAKELLIEELKIVEEDCAAFLPGENPTTEEIQAFMRKKAQCR